ncbi:MAG: MBL fold metallo-hydrolase [Desulfovibrionaceae bacterium]|nr:MBL fold metallo-hydrolase [Desulfovibrionaceae bacterium]
MTYTAKTFLLLGLGFIFLLCPAAAAEAGTDVPFTRLIFQDEYFKVTAIEDRPGSFDVSLFSGPASQEERAAYFDSQGKTPSSVHVLLAHHRPSGDYILIDAGFGDSVPGESRLLKALEGLGLAPSDINAIVLTHLHPDHVGGLLWQGRRAFPKAKVFLSEPERDYWLDLARKAALKDPGNAGAALAKNALEAYGEDVHAFRPGEFSLPINPKVLDYYSLRPVDAHGHTPGHIAVQLMAKSEEKPKLLFIGDLLHAAALQFPRPEEYPSYDVDPQTALAARRRVLDMAAEQGIPVAGIHIPFPGTGTVEKYGEGYRFIPLP